MKSNRKHQKFNKDNSFGTIFINSYRFPWVHCGNNAKQRCNNPKNNNYHRYGGRGIKFFITVKEIKKLWFRDKAYLMERPSIDRIDNNGHYTFDNCRFIELSENVSRANRKKVFKYDLKNNLIVEYKSITQASEFNNISKYKISQCAKGKQNSAGGYIWKFGKI